MTTFLRLLAADDKAEALESACASVRSKSTDSRVFQVLPDSFRVLPSVPFSYWISEPIRQCFAKYKLFESNGRTAKAGLQTSDNFRFLRLNWEISALSVQSRWFPYAKGGAFSRYYSGLNLVLMWASDGSQAKAFVESQYGGGQHWSRNLRNVSFMFRLGITWSTRTTSKLSVRILPRGCAFDTKGCAAFVADDREEDVLALLAIVNSTTFDELVSLQLAAGDAAARSYDTGLINRTPIPDLSAGTSAKLALLGRRAWSLKRNLDTVEEVSRVFLLPAKLRARPGNHDPSAIEAELAQIQGEIDDIVLALYGFSESDSRVALASSGKTMDEILDGEETAENDTEDEDNVTPVDQTAGLVSWAVGVAFGRFDWRLATGDRAVPSEPDPFDPLPAKSPGMLPDGEKPFHAQAGILVDDPGHPHDLAHWAEEVLARVDAPAPTDVRRWLQRDFFSFHLQNYSKSRRKAPIYWPLSTASGSYTLWLYYPSLTSQTLYTAINDFIEGPNGKLKQVEQEGAALRNKGSARSPDEDKKLEALQLLESELVELRDALLQIAPTYRPDHDDGVQITAAPLWPLFRHKPWQKLLKDTWTKLEKGDYDWAHLAMAYWPERVREKCKTDKSLAIAHDLETLYAEPESEPKPAKKRRGAQ
jgi:hypothetical protein